MTEDGQYLIISIWRGTEQKNQVFYKSLAAAESPVVELITGFDAEYEFIGNDGPLFWFVTDNDAPLRRVIAIDTSANPGPQAEWKEVVPESKDTLLSAAVVGEHFAWSTFRTPLRPFASSI